MNEKELASFTAKIAHDPATQCWVWTAARNERGYPIFNIGSVKDGNRRTVRAHRLSFHHFTGIDPLGLCVCHRCDNPPCVNPDHLFLGTDQDNANDMVQKGRHRSGLGPQKGESNVKAKLTEAQVLHLLQNLAHLNNKKAAEQLGVTHQLVSKIRLGHVWGHVPR